MAKRHPYKKEIPSFVRDHIVDLFIRGESQYIIAKEFRLHHTTVRYYLLHSGIITGWRDEPLKSLPEDPYAERIIYILGDYEITVSRKFYTKKRKWLPPLDKEGFPIAVDKPAKSYEDYRKEANKRRKKKGIKSPLPKFFIDDSDHFFSKENMRAMIKRINKKYPATAGFNDWD